MLHHILLNLIKYFDESLLEQEFWWGKTALHDAAFGNSKETAELLVSLGININEKTALHTVALNNSKEAAELLISHCANINEKDK